MDSLDKLDINNDAQLVSLDTTDSESRRGTAIGQYYGNKESVTDRLNKSSDISEVMDIALNEIAKTVDNLSGNEQILLNQDRLEDSTIVSVKKTEVLERLVNVASKKQDVLSKGKNIDLNSPAFKLFQSIVAEKMFETLNKYDIDNDLIKLIMKTWVVSMKDWDKELKERLKGISE